MTTLKFQVKPKVQMSKIVSIFNFDMLHSFDIWILKFGIHIFAGFGPNFFNCSDFR